MTSEPRMRHIERPPLFEDESGIDKGVFEVLSDQDEIRRSLGAIACIGVRMSGFNGLVPDTDKIKIAMKDDRDKPHVVIGGFLIDKLEDEAKFEKNVNRLCGLWQLVQAKNLSIYRS